MAELIAHLVVEPEVRGSKHCRANKHFSSQKQLEREWSYEYIQQMFHVRWFVAGHLIQHVKARLHVKSSKRFYECRSSLVFHSDTW
jgi:hypothetical protein